MRESSKRNERRKAVEITVETAACGIDLGAKWSEICLLDAAGEKLGAWSIRTTREGLAKVFAKAPAVPIVIETGGQSNWIGRALRGWGHAVTVADAKRVKLISDTHSKDDRRDARLLAEILLKWPAGLSAVRPRSLASEQGRALLKLREALVETRVKLINTVRGVAASFGRRLPAATAEAFAAKARAELSRQAELPPATVEPTLQALEALNVEIAAYERRVRELCKGRYQRATGPMLTVRGVGTTTALAYALELDDDPQRLTDSRAAGALVGLRPQRRSSGERDPELGITKAGNKMLRKLLIQCAQYILGPLGGASGLRQWGLRLAERSQTKRGKRRAIVATARKLAVLLHTLWKRDEDFDPTRGLAAAAGG